MLMRTLLPKAAVDTDDGANGARACEVMDFEPYGCLRCPLPVCVHDPAWERLQAHGKALRDTMLRQRYAAVGAEQAARETGVSKRTVHRATRGMRDA